MADYKIRRVNKVPSDSVNLAYVAIPSAPAESMVDIVDPSGTSGVEVRRIMYADVAGRLVDAMGDPGVASAYPVVSDLFYDKDSDRILDADEVLPEAALPYRYRSKKTYYGRAVYPSSGGNTETTISTHGDPETPAYACDDSTMTISGLSGLTASALVGKYIVATGMTYNLVDGQVAPELPLVYREITANTTTSITYDEMFFLESDRDVGGSVVDNISFRVIEADHAEASMFSLVGTENIKLVDQNGQPYTGRYMMLLQRASAEEVSQGQEHEGYSVSWIHVMLDRADTDLFLEYMAGSISTQDGIIGPVGDIGLTSERVEPYENFRYSSMEFVTDYDNAGKKVVASVPYKDSYALYSTDRAVIDPRVIDPLVWRVRLDVERDTKVKSDKNRDELKVGVIGDVPDALAAFLDGDALYSFRMKCVNPYPLGGRSTQWQIDQSRRLISWSKYDLVIMRGSNIEWTKYHKIAAEVVASGGIVLIDATGRDVYMDSTYIASQWEKTVPDNMKIAASFDLLPSISGTTIIDGVGNVAGGYDISAQDISQLVPTYDGKTVSINHLNRTEGLVGKSIIKTFYNNTEFGLLTLARAGVFVSTLNLTAMDNNAKKQLFCNLVWAACAADPTRILITARQVKTIYSPWETSWVAGFNVDGDPILTDAEMVEFGFTRQYEESSNTTRIERSLSDKSVAQIMGEAVSGTEDSNVLLGADKKTYTVELAGHDEGHVFCNGEVSDSTKPKAWSTRDTSQSFRAPGGYVIKSFMEEPTPGSIPVGPENVIANVRVVGTQLKVEQNEFSWSMTEGYTFDSSHGTVKEIPLTSGSGYVDYVTTWSDLEWNAPYMMKDHNVRSEANLKRYGHGGITAYKWYPWDGQSFLASLSHNHGSYVSYVQRALNALAEVNRGHRTGKLKVDGNFGGKTDAAVRDYQNRWGLTVDGDVDAGTAGHMMRNAGTFTSWKDLDDRWKKYGNPMNIVDGSDSTLYGKRTWLNSRVSRMHDYINIYLKRGVKITQIEIEPYLLGDGASQYLHIYKIGGRRDDNHKKMDWDYDKTKTMSHAWRLKGGRASHMHLDMPNELDMVSVSLFQDNTYSNHAKMWGVRNVIAYGKITVSSKKTQRRVHQYNPTFTIVKAVHDATAKTTTLTTKETLGFVARDQIWVSGLTTAGTTGKFSVLRVTGTNTIVYSSNPEASATETPTGSCKLSRYLSVKIATGEQKTIVIKPWMPSGSKFKAWEATEAEIATHIKSSLVSNVTGSNISSEVDVNVDIRSDGSILVTFSSPFESSNSEVSAGRELTVQLKHDRVYGLDNEYIVGSTTTGTTLSSIKDSTKYWVNDQLVGSTVRILTGSGAGLTRTIISNTADTFTVNAALPSGSLANGTEYEIQGSKCIPLYVTGTPTASGSSTVLKTGGTYNANSLIGATVMFRGDTANEGRNAKIVGNTATDLTLYASGTALTATTTDDDYTIILGHWPAFDDLAEDEAFSRMYRVEVLNSTDKVMGVFLITDSDGNVIDSLKEISYSDIMRYGFDNVKVGITNLHLTGDASMGSMNRFPVRYAMKPYCIVEKVSGCDIDIKGLSGTETNEIWGVVIESASVKKSVQIPSGLCIRADDKNTMSSYQSVIESGQNQTAECIYRIAGGNFSTEHGEPFVDVSDEVTEILDYNTHTGSVQLSMFPIKVDGNGEAVVSLTTSNANVDITIESVDVDSGIVFFHAVGLASEEDQVIADYTYREQYLRYTGTYANGEEDLFDLCPYNGHFITIDGSTVPVSSAIGIPLYIYALPNTVRVGETVVNVTRSVYHTAFSEMFDSDSVFYNPFAMLIGVATVKGISDASKTRIIDTRSGGGGLAIGSESKYLTDERLIHYSGFNEVQGFFDIGHMDGKAFLKGGSVIIRIPNEWKTTWESRGEDANEMVREFVERWVAAGKSVTVAWIDDNYEIVDMVDLVRQ